MSFDLNQYQTPGSPIQSNDKVNFTLRKKFSDKKKEAFYRELDILLRSGVDVKKALELLAEQVTNKFDKAMISEVKDRVTKGKSINEALRKSGHFSPYEYYSVQIGEETKKLEEILCELQKYFARKIQMRRHILSMLTYPVIVLVITVLVLYFMLDKVVPMFSSVFRQFGSELPKSTLYIIKLSEHSGALFMTLLSVTIITIVVGRMFRENVQFRKLTSAIVLRIPYFGSLVRKIYIARFCQSMKLLISSRSTLLTSLSLTGKMIGFYPIEKSIENIITNITKGGTLSDSLRSHKVYDHKVVSMIEVAEQVNQLEVMFERLTEQYNDEINHQTKMIGVVLEPLIIIVIGLVVGIIMIAMYAPMFDLSKIINN